MDAEDNGKRGQFFKKDKFGVKRINRYVFYDRFIHTTVKVLVASTCVVTFLVVLKGIDFANNTWPLIKADRDRLEREQLEERKARYEDYLKTGK